nr:hypothetical protein [Candidatus Sigynarchaeota archaeon]
ENDTTASKEHLLEFATQLTRMMEARGIKIEEMEAPPFPLPPMPEKIEFSADTPESVKKLGNAILSMGRFFNTTIIELVKMVTSGNLSAADFTQKPGDEFGKAFLAKLEGQGMNTSDLEQGLTGILDIIDNPLPLMKIVPLQHSELGALKNRLLTALEIAKKRNESALHAEIDKFLSWTQDLPMKPGHIIPQTDYEKLPATRLGRRDYDLVDLSIAMQLDKEKELFARSEIEITKNVLDLVRALGDYAETAFKAVLAFLINIERLSSGRTPCRYGLMLGDYVKKAHIRSEHYVLRNSISHGNVKVFIDMERHAITVRFKNKWGRIVATHDLPAIRKKLTELHNFVVLVSLCIVRYAR